MRGSIARCSPGCKPSWQRFLSDPALRIESLRDTSSAFADASVSKSHDVVPAIYVDHFAGDPGTGIGSQEYASGTDFVYIHIPLLRLALGVRFVHIAESCNAACSQRFDRSGGNRVHANLALPKMVSQIPHCALERCFCHTHYVVMPHNCSSAARAARISAATIVHSRSSPA